LPEATLGVSVREALKHATDRLTAAGCDTPRLDAELLLAAAMGVDRERLECSAPADLDNCALTRFASLVARRSRREPVAYILGRKHFRKITVAVDRRVLIPRPETELLVEVGLALGNGARVVDVGTGSGAVALALKDERPDLEILGTDASSEAIEVARENSVALGLEVRFVQADLLDGIDRPLDAVLANLPYVADGCELAPEITRYEPASALFAGRDGLDAIRRLVDSVSEIPVLALEVGAGQAPAVAGLLGHAGFASVQTLRDLAGHERVVLGRL
jgi:release factor glutamine methyltransferase